MITFGQEPSIGKQVAFASFFSLNFHSLTRFGMLTACDYEKYPMEKKLFGNDTVLHDRHVRTTI